MKLFLRGVCLAMMMATTVAVNAQDWKSILGGVVQNVVGDKATTEVSIHGTWTYVAPDCQFESDNFLSKAGGELAAKEVEERLQKIYDRVGMDSCQYTFNEDGTYAFTAKGKTVKGTYVFDPEAKTVEMKTRLGFTSTAYVAVTGSTMRLVFNADKLMNVLKTLTGSAKKYSNTAATLNKLATNYDGLRLGFELKK